jgi:hypothetical protein
MCCLTGFAAVERAIEASALSGQAAARNLLARPIADSSGRYASWLSELVGSHRTDLRFIRPAAMDIAFDLNVER